MSEYQYYEFQAVDRPLTKEEMAEVRALSTRAEITPTRFMNVYNWGDFRGSPERLIEKYYDAFVYEANWGTRQFMLRLPRPLVNFADLDRYAGDDEYNGLTVREAGDYVILKFAINDEGGGGWIEIDDSEAWLPSLLSIREAIVNGDLRALYLGWLMTIQQDLGITEVDEEDEEAAEVVGEIEPPVPPGLGDLTPELERLVAFFEIDEDLLAVAAERSAPITAKGSSRNELVAWLRGLPVAEKDALIVRLLDEEPRNLKAEIQKRFRTVHPAKPALASIGPGRTRGELLHAAAGQQDARERAERERAAAEQARKQRQAATAREKYLDGLVGREESLWLHVESQAELRNASGYDEAIRLLTDLRDLAVRVNQSDTFRARLAQFRERHARKPALQARLQTANLSA